MTHKDIIRRIWDYKFIVTPYILGIYSCLNIISSNAFEISFDQSLRSLSVLLATITIFMVLSFFFSRNWYRSTFLTTLIVFIILSYGQAYRSLQKLIIGNHYIILFLSVLVFSTMVISFFKLSREKSKLYSNILFVITFIALFITLLTYTVHIGIIKQSPFRNWEKDLEIANNLSANEKYFKNTLPDVYYIILDGYGSEDTLRDYYSYDNSKFIEYLRKQGFYIAEESRSNYLQTSLSLASSLNFVYLDMLSTIGGDTPHREPLKVLIHQSEIRIFFEKLGYQFISFDSGYMYTDIQDADMYIGPFIRLNEFEKLFLTSSIFIVFDILHGNRIPFYTYNSHRKRLLYSFNQLSRIESIPGPKFVFAHLVIPHPPYVIDESGNPLTPWRAFTFEDVGFSGTQEEYVEGYISQIEFTNRQIQIIVDSIINQTDSEPIIVIQGDHGPRLQTNFDSINDTCIREAASIFNAYYIPNPSMSGLYPTITPVNTFRKILNEYFGTQLDILADKTYYSNYFQPFDFIDVTEVTIDNCHRMAGP